MNKKNTAWLYLIPLGLLFLFTPTTALVDPLPDVLGLAMLLFALLRLSEINDRLSDAAGRIRALLFAALGQVLARPFIGWLLPADGDKLGIHERPTLILLITFVWLVFQWYYMIPAMRDLTQGMQALADRFSGQALEKKTRKKGIFERLYFGIPLICILHSVFTLFPEFTVLTSEAQAEKPIFSFDLFPYADMFRVICVAFSAILMLVWWIKLIPIFTAFRRAGIWRRELTDAYFSTASLKPGYLKALRLRYSGVIIIAGLLFALPLQFDYKNVLSSSVCAAVVATGLWLLRKLSPRTLWHVRVSAPLLFVSSLAQSVANRTYLKNYFPEASLYEEAAYLHFLLYRILEGIEAVCLIYFIATLLRALYGVIKENTSEVYTGGSDDEAITRRATERLHSDFAKRLNRVFVIYALSSVCSVCHAVWQLQFGYFRTASLLCAAVAIFLTASVLEDIPKHLTERQTNKPPL